MCMWIYSPGTKIYRGRIHSIMDTEAISEEVNTILDEFDDALHVLFNSYRRISRLRSRVVRLQKMVKTRSGLRQRRRATIKLSDDDVGDEAQTSQTPIGLKPRGQLHISEYMQFNNKKVKS